MKAFVAVSLRKPLVGKLQKISAIYRYASRFFSLVRFCVSFSFPLLQGDLIRSLAYLLALST